MKLSELELNDRSGHAAEVVKSFKKDKAKPDVAATVIKTWDQADIETCLELVKRNCGDAVAAYKEGKYKIFRAVDSHEDAMLIDPTKITRQSANVINYYTLLVDSSPAWKAFPKRSNSAICSLGRTYMSGLVYHVFPIDGAVIGVAPTNDFWTSFDANESLHGFSDLPTYVVRLKQLFSIFTRVGDDGEGGSMESFKAMLDNVTWMFNEFKDEQEALLAIKHAFTSPAHVKLYRDLWEHRADLLGYLQSTLKPAGFKVKNTKTLRADSADRNECWFAAPAYLISSRLAPPLSSYL